MKINRRDLLAAAGSLPLHASMLASQPRQFPTQLPAKSAFAPTATTYLDSGAWHPLGLGARQAVDAYLAHKALDPAQDQFDIDEKRSRALNAFARLINADSDEVCFVQSTTAGENLIALALNLRPGSKVVVEGLHFPGSFHLYQQLERQGIEVTILRPQDNRISLDQFESAISGNTRLVALSLVSMLNGFEHDLARVCQIAHAKGALVYADLAQAAGSVVVDVKASNVDFAACSTYKWLMGDMGLGFLFVRKSLLSQLRRPWFGYRQVARSTSHLQSFDPPGTSPFEIVPRTDVGGHFEMGTTANTVAVQLAYSLEWLLEIGISAIQHYRQPMVDAVQHGLRRLGFEPLTPLDSRSPLVAFACPDARQRFSAALSARRIRIALHGNRVRISPSIFNDLSDIDKLIQALR